MDFNTWKQKTDFQMGSIIGVKFPKIDGIVQWEKKPNAFSAEMIENCILSYKYKEEYDPYRDVYDFIVERRLSLPSMMDAFCFLLFNNECIPSFHEFFSTYADMNFKKWDDTQIYFKGGYYDTSHLKARAFRAYPSFIRDIHFCHLSRESNLFTGSLYSLRYDTARVDCVIYSSDVRYNLHLFVDTKKANAFYDQKDDRHKNDEIVVPPGIPVKLPIKLGQSVNKKIGDFELYGERHLKTVSDIIDSYELKKAA